MNDYEKLAEYLTEVTDRLDTLGIPGGDEDLDTLLWEAADKLKTVRELCAARA